MEEEVETNESFFPLPDEGDEVDEQVEDLVEAPEAVEESEEEIMEAPAVVEPEDIVAPTPRQTQTNRAKHGAQQPQTLRRSSRLSGDAPAMSLGTIYVRRSDRLRSKPRVKYSA